MGAAAGAPLGHILKNYGMKFTIKILLRIFGSKFSKPQLKIRRRHFGSVKSRALNTSKPPPNRWEDSSFPAKMLNEENGGSVERIGLNLLFLLFPNLNKNTSRVLRRWQFQRFYWNVVIFDLMVTFLPLRTTFAVDLFKLSFKFFSLGFDFKK